MTWRIVYTRQARKDAKKVSASNLRPKVQPLLDILKEDPFQKPPPYEMLLGDLKGAYSRRINIQHRLVYQVLEEERIVKVIRMWTRYVVDVQFSRRLPFHSPGRIRIKALRPDGRTVV